MSLELELPDLDYISELLPQYEFHAVLGVGGMGAVYLAKQPALDRMVAVKVLAAQAGQEPGFADQFAAEARAMAKLVHPNIVAVFDFGQTSAGHLYFVMEYVEGENLHALIQGGRLDMTHLKQVVLQVCDALQFAHGHGVVHRDIKPANLLITSDWQVKVADFGLAKNLDESGGADEYGTPDYAAPERLSAELGAVDHRADLYSVGAMLHEMLTGYTPAAAAATEQIFTLPDPYAGVVSRCLMRDPTRRFASAKELKQALQAPAALPPPVTPQAPTPSLRTGAVPYNATRAVPRPAQHRSAPPPQKSYAGLGWAAGILALLAVIAFLVLRPDPADTEVKPTTTPGPVVVIPIVESKELNFPEAGAPPSLLGEPFDAGGAAGELGDLRGHTERVLGVAILPNQRHVLSTSLDGSLRLWDVTERKQIHAWKAKVGQVREMKLNRAGTHAALGGAEGAVQVFELATGNSVLSPALPKPGAVQGLAFSPDDSVLLFGVLGQGTFRWKPADSATAPEQLPWGTQSLRGLVDLSVGQEFLALGWDLVSGTAERRAWFSSWQDLTQQKPAGASLAGDVAALSQDGDLLALAQGNAVHLISCKTGDKHAIIQTEAATTGLQFLDGGRLLLLAGQARDAHIYQTGNAELATTLPGHAAHGFVSTAVSKDGRWWVAGGHGLTPTEQTKAGAEAGTPEENFKLGLGGIAEASSLGGDVGNRAHTARLAKLTSGGVDQEVEALKERAKSSSTVPSPQQIGQMIAELDAKYLPALQTRAANASGVDKTELQAEIQRVQTKQPLPDSDLGLASTVLKALRTVYRTQLGQVEGVRNFAAAEAKAVFMASAKDLITLRTNSADQPGLDRITAAAEEIGKPLKLADQVVETVAPAAVTESKDPLGGIKGLP